MQAELRESFWYFVVVGGWWGLCKHNERGRGRRFALVDVSKGGSFIYKKRRRRVTSFSHLPSFFLPPQPSSTLTPPPPPPPPHAIMPPLNSLPSLVISKPRDGGDDPFAAEPRQGAISYREAGEFFVSVHNPH